jgi:hypothetical protein
MSTTDLIIKEDTAVKPQNYQNSVELLLEHAMPLLVTASRVAVYYQNRCSLLKNI